MRAVVHPPSRAARQPPNEWALGGRALLGGGRAASKENKTCLNSVQVVERGPPEAPTRAKAGSNLARDSVTEMFVFILSFEDRAAVQRAFAVIADVQAIDSCVVEPEEFRIRFLATKKIGSPILERIDRGGGLVWCTRYALTQSLEAD